MLDPKYLVYDTETTGLYRHAGAEMFAFSTCDRNGGTEVYRLDGSPSRARRSREILDRLWSDRSVEKIMHNARFDVGMTEKMLGRSLRGQPIHETMALSHIFDNQHPTHSLGDLGWLYFMYEKHLDAEVHKYMTDERGLADCPESVLDPYQRADAERTMLIFRMFHPKLRAEGFEEIYEMERALVWTTLSIEDRGIMLSKTRCLKTARWCRQQAEETLAEFQHHAGGMYSPSKDAHVRYVLFKMLGMPITKRTPTGMACVDKTVISELHQTHPHPVLDCILKYRSYSRGESMLLGYINLADEDGVIHPNINPYQARTSRESCSRPNLQNVEKEGVLLNPYPVPARRAFRPRPGYVNFHIDYSGIEMRLLVHYSQDETLIGLLREGKDLHAEAAAIFFREEFTECPDPALKKTRRNASKNAQFGIGYGAAAQKTAMSLGLSVDVFKEMYAEYKARFPGLALLNRRDSDEVRERGCVNTVFGRRLRLARDKPYVGTNYRVQGTAAGVLKRAQVWVDDYLRRETSGEAGIILPIHDELVIEWPRARLGEAVGCLREIRKLMINFPMLSVPLEVDVEVSTRDWATKRKFSLEG